MDDNTDNSDLMIISGNANVALSEKIISWYPLNRRKDLPNLPKLVSRRIERFNDGELWVEINENIRGRDVFIIQPTQIPVNESVMELLIVLDAVRRSSPRRITAVLPYFGYARQDRKNTPRSPITSKLVARLIEQAGADRIITVDLHASQIQGFFEIPTDHLYASSILAQHLLRRKDKERLVVISPDVGGVARARAFAKIFECDLAIIDKRRPKAGVSEVMNVIGDVDGAHCVLFDDICDSAGTLCNAANELVKKGAKTVDAYVTHGIFSSKAVQSVEQSAIRYLVTTDSIHQNSTIINANVDFENHHKIKYVSMASLLAEAIYCIHTNKSVSKLFDININDTIVRDS